MQFAHNNISSTTTATALFLFLFLFLFLTPRAAEGQTWNVDSSGSWNTASNWLGGSPNGVGASATLGDVITQQRTITLSSTRTLGNLHFDSSSTYWVKGSTIVWNGTGATPATIEVGGAGGGYQEHWLDSKSVLQDALNVTTEEHSVLRMGGNMAGSKALTKLGDGSLHFDLAGKNTSTGALVIDGGTVVMERTSTDGAFRGSAAFVNAGGTLLLTRSNQIGDGTGVVLGGGTLATGAAGEDHVGALTLTSSSTIDLAAIGSFDLYFGSSAGTAWVPGATLAILNWSGGPAGGVDSRLYFGSSAAGLSSSQLASIAFQGFGPGAMLLSSGELVPGTVPEARTLWAGVGLLLVLLVVEARRQRQRHVSKKARN